MTLLCVALLLGAWEVTCRVRGLGPRVPDDVYVWTHARQQVEPESLVVIGASRMQGAIDLPTLAEASGRDVVQLSIAAASPIPVLESLADDETFRGVVLVGFVPQMWFSEGLPYEREARRYVDRFRTLKSSPGDRLEVWLQTMVGRILCVRNPALLPWRPGLWKSPPEVQETAPMASTRQRFYQRDAEIGPEKEKRMLAVDVAAPPPTAQTRDDVIRRVDDAVEAIRDRGGDVVFLRLPSSNRFAAFEAERAPRADYWDVLAGRVDAPTVHFADVPAMQGFVLYDGSHVHRRDSAAITQAVWDAVESRRQ